MDPDLTFIHEILTDELTADGFPLVYKGKLSHQIMNLFTSMAEAKISQNQTDTNIKRRVFHIMVEMLQNITKHSDDFEEDGVGNGLFVIGEKQEYYYVITGNIVNNEKATRLKEYIDFMNGQNKEKLDELHKEQMRGGELSEKGGAGLGIIDMIRKTGEQIIYQFEKIDAEKKFYIAKVTIRKG